MKNAILVLMLTLMCNITFGQNKEEAEDLVSEGIAYHDKGDFDGAISKYDKALELDKDNLFAYTEKALSLHSLQKYDEAIENCQKALALHPGEKGLETVYVIYGNASDALKQTDKSIEIYDEGIKQFPDYYQLHFNKGISLASVKKYDQAILCFQEAIKLNPEHASSHNAIARISDSENNRIPALLAYARFLAIESTSKRGKDNLSNLQALMSSNVTKTGKKSVSISISPDMLGDTTANGKPNENSFMTTDLILSVEAALDYEKKNKKKSEIELFIRKFETVCGSLKESQEDGRGFFWDYYVPYFVEMKDNNLLETFAHIAFVTSEDPEIMKWIKSHKSDVDKFFEWSGSFEWETH